MYNQQKIAAVIVAAGQGKRMQADINKTYLALRGKPILAYTIDAFETSQLIDEIILVVRADEIAYCQKNVIDRYGYQKIKLIAGGKTRQDSVFCGLKALENIQMVLIHDGARPFITIEDLHYCIKETAKHKATIMSVPVKETIKVISAESVIEATPNRQTLRIAQTPQSFDYTLIYEAYIQAQQNGYCATDDAMLVEKMGIAVHTINGKYTNIKITTPEDLIIAETLSKK